LDASAEDNEKQQSSPTVFENVAVEIEEEVVWEKREKLPIRWLAPECLGTRTFSTKSDWYAVVFKKLILTYQRKIIFTL
jgi:hypothetical protein